MKGRTCFSVPANFAPLGSLRTPGTGNGAKMPARKRAGISHDSQALNTETIVCTEQGHFSLRCKAFSALQTCNNTARPAENGLQRTKKAGFPRPFPAFLLFNPRRTRLCTGCGDNGHQASKNTSANNRHKCHRHNLPHVGKPAWPHQAGNHLPRRSAPPLADRGRLRPVPAPWACKARRCRPPLACAACLASPWPLLGAPVP